MEIKLLLILFVILVTVSVEGKKTGRSRGSGSGRGTSRKTSNPQPAPTSLSYPQQSAPKQSLSGWQEQSVQKPKPANSQTHSYPSGGTGLSGNKPVHTPPHQESIQRSSATNNLANQQGGTQNQAGHAYPPSTGLSGNPGSGYPSQTAQKYPQQPNNGNNQPGYPQSPGSSLSGSGQTGSAYPQQHSAGSGGAYPQAPPPYSGNHGQNNYGNNYHHPQGPPPPYTNVGPSYGGFGGPGHNTGYGSSMPGYFGSHGRGYGGVSRGPSALAGVGIAGAGIGTVLTGLALWNLARSTGRSHHTVIYDNRGQPVAVAPTNETASATDSFLADLVNCSLTISSENKTEVLAIPCAIATSFTPEADVKDTSINGNSNDETKCTVTVVTKTGKEYMTTIPCSILLNSAAENNVTEPPVIVNESDHLNITTNENDNVKSSANDTDITEPSALKFTGLDNNTFSNLNCTPVPEETRDPINPCYSVNHNLTVIPLATTEVPN